MCSVGRTASRKRVFVRSSSQPTTSNTSSIRTRPTKLRFCPPGCPDIRARRAQHTERGSSASLPLHDDQSSAPAPVVPGTHSIPPTFSIPDESVLEIEKPRPERAIVNTKPPLPADGPADSHSIRSANATSGGIRSASLLLLDPRPPSFGALNRTPEVPSSKSSIYFPKNIRRH